MTLNSEKETAEIKRRSYPATSSFHFHLHTHFNNSPISITKTYLFTIKIELRQYASPTKSSFRTQLTQRIRQYRKENWMVLGLFYPSFPSKALNKPPSADMTCIYSPNLHTHTKSSLPTSKLSSLLPLVEPLLLTPPPSKLQKKILSV